MNRHTQASELLAGRWQIPLALVAVIVGGTALYRLMPAAPRIDYEAILADVALLEQAGDVHAASDAVANLLGQQPPPPPAQRAALHQRLADLTFAVERERSVHNIANVQRLLENQQAAWDLGRPPTPASRLQAALARKWLGSERAALKELRALLAEDLDPDDRRLACKSVIQLLERQPEARPERRRLLTSLLDEPSVAPEHAWWCLQTAIRDALDEGDAVRARALLERYGDRLKTSDLKGYLEYLSALVLLHEGRAEEAEPLVRWIDEWLDGGARTTRALDEHGYLPGLNRWLLGCVHLAQNRPQDALAAFEEALRSRPGPDLFVAASVGQGRALAALGRHPAALEALRAALARVQQEPEHRRRAVEEFRQVLLELFGRQDAAGDDPSALGYLELAADLAGDDEPELQRSLRERLGRAYGAAARRCPDDGLRRTYEARAGDNLVRAAGRVRFDEPHLAALLWSAAEAYDRAGRIGQLREVLSRFVTGRTDDPRMPQALLHLGQACESLGALEEALDWYGRLAADYPRLQEAARAKVLRAGVLVMLGAEHYPEAARTLLGLLEDDYIAPDAVIYRDALLALCELLYHEGRYGEAIGRLGDFLTLYPADPERGRARFMLADAYRRSAHALRAAPAAGPAAGAAQAEGRRRLRLAADLFWELLRDADGPAGPADPAEETYTRLALFYRGDCLFELNEPDTLEEALTTYRNAAARYAGQPAALTAHVQIANIHLRRGEIVEAARAVEKARWLLRSIPEEALARAGGGDRAAWERYLAVVSSSELFREVFAGPR